ncbi:nucleolin-like [Cynara cardunculus var. scolymus]|uniref:nucleolin-like n=1 Tax=Cynara cardunculus var. scolymus TaxID=59895 RepID=UPI000D62A862|nr:nucleolin-like [Cynara cardunculus var. scolymus]
MVLQLHSVEQLSGICSQAIAKEGEIRSNTARPSVAATPTKPAAPATNDVEAEAEVEVVCDIPTCSEASIAEDVDAIRAEACDDDLPIISSPVVGDVEDEEEDDDDKEGDSPDLPYSGSDLDDKDDDDDEDDFTIQYQHPATATKGVALRDSASKWEQREEEPAPEANQGFKSKGKGVAKEGNLKVLFKSPQPLYEDSSSQVIVTSLYQLDIPSTTYG